MAVSAPTNLGTFDSDVTTISSHTFTGVTVEAGSLLEVRVAVGQNSGAVLTSSVTFDGVALTKVIEADGISVGDSAAWLSGSIWRLHVAAEITGDIVITLAASADTLRAVADKYTGHDTGTPSGDTDSVASASSSNASLTLTTAAGDMVTDVHMKIAFNDTAPTATGGQTQDFQAHSTGFDYATFSHLLADDVSETVGYTDSASVLYLAAVIKAASGGGSSKLLLQLQQS